MSKPSDHTKSSPSQSAKVRAQKRGRWAEALTALVLRLSGHRILARNFKTQVGEIDVIAKRGSVLCFIEVKARADAAQAAAAIGARQRQRIQRAAELYLCQNPAFQTCDVRFDVALVTGPLHLTLVRDAWRPG
ncbi:YraN family protein [Magnetovibrio sp.]|uniref:YraN family protein n=1 Tax=Magnetovibrio sp. TaxID=2024836 RepID=UPI002F941B17